jgi:putative endonuclease
MRGKRRYGEIEEDYAVTLLKKNGYQILRRNYKSKIGEIDIIAIDPSTTSSGPNGTLVFVEVKTRWSRKYGKPEEAVTKKKLARIKIVGQQYLRTYKNLPKKLRIDVVAIEVEKGKVASAKIIKAT